MRGLALLLVALAACAGPGPEREGMGDVIAVDRAQGRVTIRHDDIPGLAAAAATAFDVAAPDLLAGLEAGARVRFTARRRGGRMVLTALAREPAPGVHDHTPHHGGVVGMAGQLHLETLAAPDGTVRVWLTDVWRRPLPLDGVTGSVTVDLADGEHRLPLAVAGDALAAAGPAPPGPEVNAHVELAVHGTPVEMDFALPVAGGTAGAAGVPVRGCVPLTAPETGAGRRPRCVLGFPHPVTAVAATPDGSTLLIAGLDLGVSAWRLPAGTLGFGFAAPPPLRVPGPEGLRPHPEGTSALAVSPDGREAAVALEGRLFRYAVASGALVHALPARPAVIRSVAWSPDGRMLLLTAFYDPAAHLVRADDGSALRGLAVEREGAAVAFAPDGSQAVVGSDAGPIAVFALGADGAPRVLAGGRRAVQALAFAGTRLVSAGDDGVVRVWDPVTGNRLAESAVGTPLARLAIAPDGRLAASAGLDGAIHVHRTDTAAVVETLRFHTGQVLGLAWAGPVLASGGADGRVALWDVGDL